MPSFHKTSDLSTFKIFLSLLQLDRLQLTVSSLLQPTGGVNTTPHTVHFSQCCALITFMRAHAWLKFGSALIPISSRMCHLVCLSDRPLFGRLHSLLLPHLLLSDHPVLPSARQLHLPGCGGQIPCATPLRTLAPWPRTSLAHFPHCDSSGSNTMMPRKSLIMDHGTEFGADFQHLCQW